MRVYIIGNDGIRLCHEAPATVNESEIAVASNEELLAAPLSGKRLLALWNALPGVEKRKKLGDRAELIDQLWSAIEELPDPDPQPDAKMTSKQDAVIAMLQRAEGATVDEVARATGWQRHTVRGVFSGTLKKKLGLTRDLLIRALAHQLQEQSHGGVSRALRRRLQSLAGASDKATLTADPGLVLKAGTTLVRQWRGHTHTVLVHQDGFEHEGQRYRSLSVIAERITGAHWSGPRFFGLTKHARALAGSKADR